MRAAILVVLLLIPAISYSQDEYVAYFKKANVDVDHVVGKKSAVIGNGYEIRAAYGYVEGTTIKGHYVGIFLIKDGNLAEVFEVGPSERGLDFFPVIKSSNRSHAVVSFVSDYGELARREYVFDLSKDKKLVKVNSLQPEGIPDDLP